MRLRYLIPVITVSIFCSIDIVISQEVINGDLREYYTIVEPYFDSTDSIMKYDTIYEPVAVRAGWEFDFFISDTLCKTGNCVLFKPFELFEGYFTYSDLMFSFTTPLVKDSLYRIRIDFKLYAPDSISPPPHPDIGLCLLRNCGNESTAYTATAATTYKDVCTQFFRFRWQDLNSNTWVTTTFDFKAEGGEECFSIGAHPRISEYRAVSERSWVTRKSEGIDRCISIKRKQRILKELRVYFPFWNVHHMNDEELVSFGKKFDSFKLHDPGYIVNYVDIQMIK